MTMSLEEEVRTQAGTEGGPPEDAGRWWLSASPGESPQEEPSLPMPPS